jgi:3-hydroxyacyl-CoA dehydrogenase / enoyl-CoA hydratase / 3-hydroxybutyryl-CoA epimerase
MNEAISLDVGADGIATATLDLPGRTINVLDETLLAALSALIDRLCSDGDIQGLVLTSAKSDFCVGGDFDRLSRLASAQQAFDFSRTVQTLLRRMEQAGKPVVAALNGHALGGGLEIALACHARIVLDHPRLRLGHPEVKLGLMPGGGGTVRLPRIVGIERALRLLAEGSKLTARQALEVGLVDGLASSRVELLAAARAWALAHPHARQGWDQPKFAFPGGDARSPAVAPLWSVAPSMATARTFGNYPAVSHVMSSVFEGGLLGFDAASAVESRYFAACAVSPVARNLIGTLWYQLNAIKKGQSRPDGGPVRIVKRLGLLGAGMMGAGIAYVSAKAGIEVVLLDTSAERAEAGKAHSRTLLDKAIAKGLSTPDQRDALLARIEPTTRFDDLHGCDLVIEAVFEDRALKSEVTASAEAQLAQDAVFASNTSTLPIGSLAQASVRPANFIGLHFFSPVHKMSLVEIVVGRKTSAQTLARAFDYVQQIGKTPIVVNDGRGFYTSRVFATYLMEGLSMLQEGVHPRSIEMAGLQAGMPMPPLALQDEVSLSLSLQVAEQAKRDLAAEGRSAVEHPGLGAVRRFCEIGRIGRKAGKGFYDYGKDGKQLWPGLKQMFPLVERQPTQRELIDRLMFVQANEAARCFEEGVLRSVADANVGSILGWGFAPFHGGALQFINALGPASFVDRASQLAATHGPRFEPAAIVIRMAEQGALFADGEQADGVSGSGLL